MSADRRRRRYALVALELARMLAAASTVTLLAPLVVLGCIAGLGWLAVRAAWLAVSLGFELVTANSDQEN